MCSSMSSAISIEILCQINDDPNFNSSNIIEEIKNELAKVLDQDEYEEWKNENFNLNRVFKFKYDGLIYEGTLLHISACSDLKNLVNALLKAGAKVNAEDEYKQTPLHWAAESGREEAVNALLKAGAKVNARDKYKQTPLHLAAGEGYIDTVKALLKQNANPCVKEMGGNTPRDLADNDDVKQCLQDAEKAMQPHLKFIRKRNFITGGAIMVTAAFESGLAILLVTKGDLPIEPIPITLTIAAIALISLVVGYIAFHIPKEPNTQVKVNEIPTPQKGDSQYVEC